MSQGFNEFGSQNVNPFEDSFHGIDDSPFEDPSILQATSRDNRTPSEIDNYAIADVSTGSDPAIIQTTQETPKTTTTIDKKILERREKELNEKERELTRKEEELKRSNVRPNNWPPLPTGYCVQPCFYMDIETEIKIEFQNIVRHLYRLWIMNECMLVCNIVGTSALLIGFGEIKTFAVSILYLILFTPLSFLCWYRPVYKAFRNDSSVQFMVFFFVFFFQFLVTTFMAIGILGSGTCGIWTAISCFDKTVGGTITGIIVLIVALGFSATAGIELLLLAKMLNIYRGTNASMSKARAEFTSGVLGNPLVREAATEAAAASLQSHFNQQNNRR